MMLFRHHLDGLSITLADDVQTLLHARQLDALRIANNESPVVKTIICRWVKEGLVIKTDTNLWQKCQS